MVEADCDIIVCIVGWAVRNWSVEDKAGLESREERNSGYSGDNWSQKGEWTGWILKFARKKKNKKKDIYIHLSGERKTDEKNAQTRRMTKLLYTVKQGECTPVLLNIPHLLLLNWLIERVVARPLASPSLENWERKKTKQKNQTRKQPKATLNLLVQQTERG